MNLHIIQSDYKDTGCLQQQAFCTNPMQNSDVLLGVQGRKKHYQYCSPSIKNNQIIMLCTILESYLVNDRNDTV